MKAAALALSLLLAGAVLAQSGPDAGGGPPPGAPGGPGGSREKGPRGPPAPAPARVHALVGSWSVVITPKTTPVPPAGRYPLTPEYEARRAELQRKDEAGIVIEGRNNRCIPSGLPDMQTFGFRIEANADYLTVIGGTGPTVRTLWLHRKNHTASKLLFPSFGGESLAHWEGSTLVVDTVGLDPTNEITYGLPSNDPDLHIIERFRLLSPTRLEVISTLESKVALTRPYTYRYVYARVAFHGATDYCQRPLVNNELDLTPPSGGYVPPGADR